MKTPEEVLEFLGTIPMINEGGCGIAAISFWRWMEKNCPKELPYISIVYMYHNEEYRRLRQNQAAILMQKYSELWIPPHIGIFWDGSILESGGGEVQEYKLWHEVPVEALEQNLKMFWMWNGLFSRFQNIPTIEFALDISLSEFLILSIYRNQAISE